MPAAASKTATAAKKAAAAKKGTRAKAVPVTGQAVNPDSTAVSKATKTRSSPRKPPAVRPRTGTGSTASLRSVAPPQKRATAQKRSADLPTEVREGAADAAGLPGPRANPVDASSRKRRATEETPALPPRKRAAGAAASVSGGMRGDSGGVQQASDAEPSELAALRDARDQGDRTFLVFPPDDPHPARVSFRDLASLRDNKPLQSSVVDLIAKLYICETQEDFLDGMLLFETRFFDLVLDGKWDEALEWHPADKVWGSKHLVFLTRVGDHWTLHVVTSPAALLAATRSSRLSSTPIHQCFLSVFDSMASIRDVAPHPKLLDYMAKLLSLPQEHSEVDTRRLVIERTILRTPSYLEQSNMYDTSIFALATFDVFLATAGKKRKAFLWSDASNIVSPKMLFKRNEMLAFIRMKKKALDACVTDGAGHSSSPRVTESSAQGPNDGSSAQGENDGTGANVEAEPVGHQRGQPPDDETADARLVGGGDEDKGDHGEQQPTQRMPTRNIGDADGSRTKDGTGRTDDAQMSDKCGTRPHPPTTNRAARSAARDKSKSASGSSLPNANQSTAVPPKAATDDSPPEDAPAKNGDSASDANTDDSPQAALPTEQPKQSDALATAPIAADEQSEDPAADSRIKDKQYLVTTPSDAGRSRSSAPVPAVPKPQSPLSSGSVPLATGNLQSGGALTTQATLTDKLPESVDDHAANARGSVIASSKTLQPAVNLRSEVPARETGASGQEDSAAMTPASAAAAGTVTQAQDDAVNKVGLPPFCKHPGGHSSVAVTTEDMSPTLGLLLAISCGDVDACCALMCKGASLSIRGSGCTPLLSAVARGHAGIVQLFLRAKVDPNEAGGRRPLSPLQQAVYSGHLSIAQDLIDGGALVNGVTGQGLTALRVACFRQNAQAVQLLLGAGAETDAPGCLGWTALHEAVFSKDLDSTQALMRGGANVEVVDERGWTPLVIAAAIDDVDIAKALLEFHAGYTRTCVMQAASLAARTRKVRVLAVLWSRLDPPSQLEVLRQVRQDREVTALLLDLLPG